MVRLKPANTAAFERSGRLLRSPARARQAAGARKGGCTHGLGRLRLMSHLNICAVQIHDHFHFQKQGDKVMEETPKTRNDKPYHSTFIGDLYIYSS